MIECPLWLRAQAVGLRARATRHEILLRDALGEGWLFQVPYVTRSKNGATHQHILDLYHPTAKLCIEIDGSQHYIRTGRRRGTLCGHDRRRDEYLRREGIVTLRFPNSHIEHKLATVIAEIEQHLGGLQA